MKDASGQKVLQNSKRALFLWKEILKTKPKSASLHFTFAIFSLVSSSGFFFFRTCQLLESSDFIFVSFLTLFLFVSRCFFHTEKVFLSKNCSSFFFSKSCLESWPVEKKEPVQRNFLVFFFFFFPSPWLMHFITIFPSFFLTNGQTSLSVHSSLPTEVSDATDFLKRSQEELRKPEETTTIE